MLAGKTSKEEPCLPIMNFPSDYQDSILMDLFRFAQNLSIVSFFCYHIISVFQLDSVCTGARVNSGPSEPKGSAGSCGNPR